jgi:hypothetical protein
MGKSVQSLRYEEKARSLRMRIPLAAKEAVIGDDRIGFIEERNLEPFLEYARRYWWGNGEDRSNGGSRAEN